VSAPEANRQTDSPRAEWLGARGFAFALATLIVLTYPQVILGWKSFYFRDFGYFGYPLASYQRECFWRGELPLWNPLSSCGIPFLAQWNTLTLYPGALIYLLLPLPWSLNLFCLAHVLLAGTGMYQLARRWTGSGIAASVAGTAFAFNGLTLNCLMWPNNIAALGWMPWVALCAESAGREGGRRVIIAAFVGAAQMMCGAPEIILLTWTVIAGLWLMDLWRADGDSTAGRASRIVMISRLAVVVTLVAGLSAAQLLPFLELLQHSDRGADFTGSIWAMPAWGWANLLVPLYGCYRSTAGVFFPIGEDWTSSYYPGVGVFGLAVAAAVGFRDRRAHWLTALTIAGLILALGDQGYLYGALTRWIPQFRLMRYPIKFVVLANFSTPLLAAFAVGALAAPDGRAAGNRTRRSFIVAGLGLFVLIIAITWFGSQPPGAFERGLSPWRLAVQQVFFLVAILAVGKALARVGDSPHLRWRLGSGALLIGLIWLDTRVHAPNQNPTVAPDVLAPGLLPASEKMTPVPTLGAARAFLDRAAHDQIHKAMSANPQTDYLVHRLWLAGDCNLLDGIPTVDSFYSLYLREQRDVWSLLFFAPAGKETAPLLDLMGVSQVSDDSRLAAWKSRPNPLPFVTIGQRPVFADRLATLHELNSPHFDPRAVVYLPLAARPAFSATNQATGTALLKRFSAHRLEIETHADAATVLFISESYYPAWHAYLDGKAVPLWRADHAFQAVAVPGGASHVVIAYEDRTFLIGMLISLATGAACANAWRRDSKSARR